MRDSKQRSVQQYETRSTQKLKIDAFDVMFLGWGAITFFVASHMALGFKIPFIN